MVSLLAISIPTLQANPKLVEVLMHGEGALPDPGFAKQ